MTAPVNDVTRRELPNDLKKDLSESPLGAQL